jgi:hypothetical protein
VGANFRNRISMQPMRSHEVKGSLLPYFLAGGAGGVKSCLVWRVDFPTFIFHWDSGLLMEVWGVGVGGGGAVEGVKAKSYQVYDMFPKEFSITPHFYLICFGKCCSPCSPKSSQ